MPDISTATSLYLRVEGVNFSSFVLDTEDLSTMRGGGLLLLEAVKEDRLVVRELKKHCVEVSAISTGASSGLFRVVPKPGITAETLVCHVRTALESDADSGLRYGTFVVSASAADFTVAREALLAANRWEQMQSPTVAVPTRQGKERQHEVTVCAGDGISPATVRAERKLRDDGHLSDAAFFRREHGRKQKQRFYGNLCQDGVSREFVTELGDLSGNAKAQPRQLQDKVAVIYLDGNHFGKIQQACTTEESLRAWDAYIKMKRGEFLAALLQTMDQDPAWRNEGLYRLETLMWGGDELMFVVPAWKGWEAMGLFYAQSAGWSFSLNPKDHGVPSQTWRLTHAACLVFAHHRAPVQRLKKLAMHLAEDAKQATHRAADAFLCETLESFDHIGADVPAYRRMRFPGLDWLQPCHLALDASRTRELRETLKKLRDADFPVRRIKMLVGEFLASQGSLAPEPTALEKDITSDVGNFTAAQEDLLREWLAHLGPAAPAAWLHLAMLWDYIALPD